jgi:hypothetical protein
MVRKTTPKKQTAPNPPLTREGILDAASVIVHGQRDAEYGGPEDSFERIARYWSVTLNKTVTPVDVARMMMLLKVARLDQAPLHSDSWIDVAGYAACGAEVASKTHKEKP